MTFLLRATHKKPCRSDRQDDWRERDADDCFDAEPLSTCLLRGSTWPFKIHVVLTLHNGITSYTSPDSHPLPSFRLPYSPAMFHTFNLHRQPPKAKPVAAIASGSETPRKRQKVSKACDRCRMFRVKCGEKPCSQCLASKVKCVTSSDSPGHQDFNLDFAAA